MLLRLRVAAGGILAVILSCALISPNLSAATTDGQFAVERPGQAKCSRFLNAKAAGEAEYARLIGFVEGYLSAANRYEPNTFDLTPWHNSQGLGLILTKHCEQFPDEALGVAVQKLVGAFMPIRLASFSALQTVGDDKNSVEVYQTIMVRAQRELSRRGLYAGETTGRFNPAMQAALAKFQQTAGLDPTGVPDSPTLWVLLNP